MRDYMSERAFAGREPSPHPRGSGTGAMAEAMSSAKSPGLIRRLSRGAQNKLRRRASTTHSMRLRDQSAGPVLVRQRSDSIGASDAGQDVSDLDLDNVTDDPADEVPEVPHIPYSHTNREKTNGLGISAGRLSNASSTLASTFEGGIAPASSAVLENGTWVTKMTKRQKKRIKLWLDPNSARVCWHSTRTSKSFFIDDIREYRVGAQSRNARDDVEISDTQENLWVTIVYDTTERSQGRSIKTMHVLMPDDYLLKLWTDALDTVARQRVEIMNALSLSPEKNEKSMALAWRQAMNRTGQARDTDFNLDDARWLCRKLEINCTDDAVSTHFKAIAGSETTMDYYMYKKFVQSFRERKEIQHLYHKLQFGAEISWDIDVFLDFLRIYQKVDIVKDQAHWEMVFEKFARPSQQRNVTSDSSSTGNGLTLSLQGFHQFLASSYNSPLVSKINDPTLDRPLNEYFISSSHNTYLLGRQVRGTSSVEGYIATLVKGCRCIEIDCWDGENGRPMVTHGRTMTTKVPFEDCVSVVAKYAFNSSPYPLIVSLEVHCNPEQQLVMVDLMKKYFREMMVTEPIIPGSLTLPSPQELKNRILIKVKTSATEEIDSVHLTDSSGGRSRSRSLTSNLARAPSSDYQSASASPMISGSSATSPAELPSFTPRGASVPGPLMTPASSADDSDELMILPDKARKRKTSRIIPELGRLGVYASGIKFTGFQDPKAKSWNHIFSLAENVFDKLSTKNTDEKALLEKHNTRYLMRVYPSNLRVDSSNFNPLQSWRRGVQMAALNWQNYDVHQQINEAMFVAGSDRSGYVLKPEELRHAKHLPIADTIADTSGKKEKKGKKLLKFSVEIISAQRLPRPRTQNNDNKINPYIEFEVISPDDRSRGNTTGDGGADASSRDGTPGTTPTLRKRTKIVEGNGFDPQWYSTMTMAIETKFPALVFLRWNVWNSPDGKNNGNNPSLLATYTAKLDSLQQGFRYLPLFNPHGEQYRDAKLFVRIDKENPIPLQLEDNAYGIMEIAPPSPRPDAIRSQRSWPMRIFTRNPSQRKKDRTPNDSSGAPTRAPSIEKSLSRTTTSEDFDSARPS